MPPRRLIRYQNTCRADSPCVDDPKDQFRGIVHRFAIWHRLPLITAPSFRKASPLQMYRIHCVPTNVCKGEVAAVTLDESVRLPAEDRRSDGRSERWSPHRRRRRQELLYAAVAAIEPYGPQVGAPRSPRRQASRDRCCIATSPAWPTCIRRSCGTPRVISAATSSR